MGREVRRVPKDWNHPKDDHGGYIPLHEPSAPLRDMILQWWDDEHLWSAGEHPDQQRDYKTPERFCDWDGGPPNPSDYMPWWPDEMKTHYQMYETCSEGTPISPVMDTPEDLARWLADHDASAFADMTATYDQWLAMINRGSSPSAMSSSQTGFVSGVVAVATLDGDDR